MTGRRVVGLLLGFALARLLFAATLGLGRDEAYTLVISRAVALSYFDHPPLHQWLAHFAVVLTGETVWARLPFIVLFGLAGWFLFLMTRALYGAQAALVAIVAANLAPFFFAAGGSWIVPDGPLLAMLALAGLALAQLFFGSTSRESAWRLWLCVGLAFGLAGLSKYSAALTALGVLGFLLSNPRQRKWLRRPEPYAAALLTLIIVSPVFIWNREHDWASFRFQGGRAALGGGGGIGAVLAMALGEAAYLLPWTFAALTVAAIEAIRKRDERSQFLLWLAAPPIVAFTIIPFWGDRGLPHWTMPGWFFLFPLLGKTASIARLDLKRWMVGSGIIVAAIAVLVVSQARLGWMERLAGRDFPEPTLEALDWSDLQLAPAVVSKPAFVVTTKWWEGGKVGVALGPAVPIFVFSDDPRGIAFLSDGSRFVGKDGLIIAERRRLEWIETMLKPYFASLDPLQSFSFKRGGRDEEELVLIGAHDLTRPFPVPYRLDQR